MDRLVMGFTIILGWGPSHYWFHGTYTFVAFKEPSALSDVTVQWELWPCLGHCDTTLRVVTMHWEFWHCIGSYVIALRVVTLLWELKLSYGCLPLKIEHSLNLAHVYDISSLVSLFIARKGSSPFLGCLLASCTLIDELVGGLTPHIGGYNY
jgi:hypothetical protein